MKTQPAGTYANTYVPFPGIYNFEQQQKWLIWMLRIPWLPEHPKRKLIRVACQ